MTNQKVAIIISLLFAIFGVGFLLSLTNHDPYADVMPTLAQIDASIDSTQHLRTTNINVENLPIGEEMIIQFPGNSTEELETVLSTLGAEVVQDMPEISTAIVIKTRPITQQQLTELPTTVIVEPNYKVQSLLTYPSNDPMLSEQWSFTTMDASTLWKSVETNETIVAVIDSGVCFDHPDLQGRFLDGGYDYVDDDTNPTDEMGHGCAVSGIITANANNGIGIAGIAPNTKILPFRVLDEDGIGTYSDVISAIYAAVSAGADIINLSLGGRNHSQTLEQAVNYASLNGVDVVAGSGNTGTEGVFYPARYASVIAVGSYGQHGNRSSFSTYGIEVDTLAPGENILTTTLDGSYSYFTGTSMAVPYVTGLLALSRSSGQPIDLANISNTPPPSNTQQVEALNTSSPSLTPTYAVFTPTPAPFTCSDIKLTDITFYENRVELTLANLAYSTNLESIELHLSPIDGYLMHPALFVLDEDILWSGDNTSSLPIYVDETVPSYDDVDHWGAANVAIPFQAVKVVAMYIANTPIDLSSYSTSEDLAGTKLAFTNPANPNSPCMLYVPEDLDPNIPTGCGITQVDFLSLDSDSISYQVEDVASPKEYLTDIDHGFYSEFTPISRTIYLSEVTYKGETVWQGNGPNTALISDGTWLSSPWLDGGILTIHHNSSIDFTDYFSHYEFLTRLEVHSTATNSDCNFFTNVLPPSPDSPTNLSGTLVGESVDLFWTDSATVETNFIIERQIVGSSWQDIVTLPANTTYFSAPIACNVVNRWRVRAYNSNLNTHSPPSYPVTFYSSCSSATPTPNPNPTHTLTPSPTPINCTNYSTSYILGTVQSNYVVDLQRAIECANQSLEDNTIDLNGETVTFDYAPSKYDYFGFNALEPIATLASGGRLTIQNGKIERDINSGYCDESVINRSRFRLLVTESNSHLTLSNMTIKNGCALDYGANSDKNGGGIYNQGTLLINDSLITLNKAIRLGGGVYNAVNSTITVNNSIFTHNFGISGGGIFSDHDNQLTIANSSFSFNSAYGECNCGGGGISVYYHSSVNITNSAFNYNFADGFGGGIEVDTSTLTLVDSVVSDNTAFASGGGIYHTNFSPASNIIRSKIDNNHAEDYGGGLFHQGGRINITDSTISNNFALDGGGGVDVRGTIVITASTINGNATNLYGAGIRSAYGSNPLTLSNSTLYGNLSYYRGGGFSLTGSSLTTLYNTTIANNSAVDDGGGVFIANDAVMTIANSIIADSPSGGDCWGTINFSGMNLIEDDTCNASTNGQLTGDPKLDPIGLQLNTGAVSTVPLLSDSPAIDVGDDTQVNGLTYDQRGVGYNRIYGTQVDLGAYEYQPILAINTPSPVPSPTLTPYLTATATPTTIPFSCNYITVNFRAVPFSSNRVYIEISNENTQDAFLIESEIHWDKTPVLNDFPNINLANMALDSNVYWVGNDANSPTIAGAEGSLFYDPDARDHLIFAPSGGEKIDWQGQFINGPSLLSSYFEVSDFVGTNFTFDNPDDSLNDCQITAGVLAAPTSTPTATFTPSMTFTPSPTYTPSQTYTPSPTFTPTATPISCTSYANYYVIGTVQSDLEKDLQRAVECANQSPEDNIIDLIGQTVSFVYGPSNYEYGGFNALQPIAPESSAGHLTIQNGTIERASQLNTCMVSSVDTSQFRILATMPESGTTLTNLTIKNGCVGYDYANADNGGGILNYGSLQVVDSIFTLNQSTGFGGGIFNNNNGQISIVNSIFTANSGFSGGAIFNRDNGYIFITDSTVSQNSASVHGGGIMNYDGAQLDITNTTINHNTASVSGGGIHNYYETEITISGSTIANNTASEEGGGIYTESAALLDISKSIVTENSAKFGGGIFNDLRVSQLNITDTTINNNIASITGGGIYNGKFGQLMTINSTIYNNSAGNVGGGLYLHSGSDILTTNILNSTFADNIGGGIYVTYIDGIITMSNSIVANSSGKDDCNGTITFEGVNLISDGSCNALANGQLTGDPLLDPVGLKNNGGLTQTIALLEDSPAIDVGDNSLIPVGVTTDQRGIGYPRTFGTQVDLGAFEVQAICTAYVNMLPTGYTVGTLTSDLEADLRLAVECANASDTDDIIDLNGATLTYSDAPEGYDLEGHNALQPITSTSIGGTLTIQNGTIMRDSNLICDAITDSTDEFRFLYLMEDSNLTLSNMTLANGCAVRSTNDGYGIDTYGGAIYSEGLLSIDNSTLNNNVAKSDQSSIGGAIYGRDGSIFISNSLLDGNYADTGGAIYTGGVATEDVDVAIAYSTIQNNNALFAGGIYIAYSDLTVDTSIFVGNTSSSLSGAIHTEIANTVNINNSTFYNNSASTLAGAVHIYATQATITHSTFSNNPSDQAESIYVLQTPLTLTNSILADGVNGSLCSSNITGLVTYAGMNQVEDGSCEAVAGGQLMGDPLLGALQNNGGSTQTMALLVGSPAINAGDNSQIPAGVTTDQRGIGYPRIFDVQVDLGAYEYQSYVLDGFATTTVTDSSVSLSWNDPSSYELEYHLSRSIDSVNWSPIATISGESNTYTDSTVLCETSYSYRLVAVYDSLIPNAVEVSVTTPKCEVAIPDSVTTTISSSSASISWNPIPAQKTTEIIIERAEQPAESLVSLSLNWQTKAILSSGMSIFTDDDIRCGMIYWYRIQGYNQRYNEYTSYSDSIEITTSDCPVPVTNTVGLYQNGIWAFRDGFDNSSSTVFFRFGPQEAGWIPLAGDWDGDGIDGIGIYKDGVFALRDVSDSGVRDYVYRFGDRDSEAQPIVGDWDGDGKDTVGLYKDGVFILTNSHESQTIDYQFIFGKRESGWTPIAGDWTGGGRDFVGVYKDDVFQLHDSFKSSQTGKTFRFGPATGGWIAIAGDWNADGNVTIGVYKDNSWRLRNSNSRGQVDIGFTFGTFNGVAYPIASYRGGDESLEALAFVSTIPLPEISSSSGDQTESTLNPTETMIATVSPTQLETTATTTVSPTEANVSPTPTGTLSGTEIEIQPTVTQTATLKATPSQTPTIEGVATDSPTGIPTEDMIPSTTAEPTSIPTLLPSPSATLAPTATYTATQARPEVTQEPIAP